VSQEREGPVFLPPYLPSLPPSLLPFHPPSLPYPLTWTFFMPASSPFLASASSCFFSSVREPCKSVSFSAFRSSWVLR
jgi:hypothetical protein